MFTYFSNESIRKLVIGFGSLFNNVVFNQKDKDGNTVPLKVPLTYAPKERYIKRLTLPSSISDTTRIEFNNPQLSFELADVKYDPLRHLNKLHKKQSTVTTGTTGSTSYMEAPYNFTFNLYAYTRNISENLEVMEQILPYFTPEFIITLNFTDLHRKVDVPISLIQTSLTQDYEGDFSTRRVIISTYQFVAKSYVFNRVATEGLIGSYSANIDIDGYEFGITGATGG